MRIDTRDMDIHLTASSVRYEDKRAPPFDEREVTGVSSEHLDAVARADETPGFSASATVKVLTYLHRNEHFDSAGQLLPPAADWQLAESSGGSAIDRRGRVRL